MFMGKLPMWAMRADHSDSVQWARIASTSPDVNERELVSDAGGFLNAEDQFDFESRAPNWRVVFTGTHSIDHHCCGSGICLELRRGVARRLRIPAPEPAPPIGRTLNRAAAYAARSFSPGFRPVSRKRSPDPTQRAGRIPANFASRRDHAVA